MAEPIDYQPRSVATELTPEEDVARLVQALHDSGFLRFFADLALQFPQLCDVVVGDLARPKGRNLLGNVLLVSSILSEVDAKKAQHIAGSLGRGMEAAMEKASEKKPESMIHLAAALKDPDVRRGLGAALAFLAELGRAGKETEEKKEEKG